MALIHVTNSIAPAVTRDNLDVLVDQQREAMRLAEEALTRAETQASALTTAGVALGALLVTAVSGFGLEGVIEQAFATVVAGALAIAVAAALIARIVMAMEPRRQARSEGANSPLRVAYNKLAEAQQEFERLDDRAEKEDVARKALALWKARTTVAQLSSKSGRLPIMVSAIALYAAIVMMFASVVASYGMASDEAQGASGQFAE